MKFWKWVVALAVVIGMVVEPSAEAETSGVQTIFSPSAGAGYVDPGVMYARAITLQHNGAANGTMLTTFETYTTSTPYFPVYKSTDGGGTWSYLSQVDDTVNGWNPQIYELPAALGSLPAGTLLEAGLLCPPTSARPRSCCSTAPTRARPGSSSPRWPEAARPPPLTPTPRCGSRSCSCTAGGYSRSLTVMPDGNTVMTLTGGFHDSHYLNQVQFAFDNIAPGISDGATYTLTNNYSNLNLGATATTNGTPVVQLTASRTAAQQQWVLTRQQNGYFTVTNVASGLELTVTGASASNGATAELESASPGTAAQDWSVVQQSDGSFKLANRLSDLLLDDYKWATTSGSAVDQWADNGGGNQRRTLTQITFPNLISGRYSIQNNYAEYLEIPAGSAASGTQADQWWYADQPWHLWSFAAVNGGYRIVNGQSGLVLTDTYPASGEAITQTAAVSGDSDQVWTLVPHGNQFLIKNAGTGRFVTIAKGSSADLANAVSWTELDTPDQLWTVRRINTT